MNMYNVHNVFRAMIIFFYYSKLLDSTLGPLSFVDDLLLSKEGLQNSINKFSS